MALAEFTTSEPLTLGVELELQLVSTHDFDLAPQAEDLLRVLAKHSGAWDVKPEITRSMIEIGTSIQREHSGLVAELHDLRGQLSQAARKLNIGIAGGGTHAYQHWSDQQIFPTERFHYISELYGYLAKQFTVFGQHVHVGCEDGDTALWLLHALSRYVPHFIALSASSPFVQGVDTGFDSARLNSVFAFPLSGRAPFVTTWDDFGLYFDKMTSTGVVQSMKDFYWDIRPKPEFGTIELRVCDTPLDVDKAAALACYLQAICRYLREERPFEPSEDDYLVYTFNRFQACRFGLDGEIVDPQTKQREKLRDNIVRTLARVDEHALDLRSLDASNLIRDSLRQGNDAQWLRGLRATGEPLSSVVHSAADRWMP
ncbi:MULTISPECIES: YbdK family carboxylate-amine ligase [unclassified Rhizobacter]|jgi:carboxylate-amine ligase|uniref:YbdK family carboxylate-amine ligase n=1 Tax=unclassified Rhizobacter TaxID=2640088 RepID=UPI0006F41B02|nr:MULTISPECIES: YbdK family carboxylate-amine ligase [unclassified Rhizobacter]KQU68423.1 gamma-glutamyl ligase [Rhizobacter sp. Root29]KQW14489.1 gamma-glutamyl ligase [Rhizobacter sp. Root1238]KRB16695.1 gamma-glutamyl ligase [Rhizobacter sp. Root16D2]